jgi:short-subunit dehydrogenase
MSEDVRDPSRADLAMPAVTTNPRGTALITGASAGIGAIYANRLARRGHDLILVARNRERLDALATRITENTGRAVKVIAADLNDKADLTRVEHALRTDSTITMLVNNAGTGGTATFPDADINAMDRMIGLNVTALVRLTHAIVPAFIRRGSGTIVNMASVIGLAPENLTGAVYAATKGFVIAFSLSLQKELAETKIRVQAVLPGATATDFWDAAGTPLHLLPSGIVMTTGDLVDAALAGLDQGEQVTIPALPDISDWETYEAARHAMMPNLSRSSPAARYGVPAA